MLDTEMLKLVLNGGMFGLLTIIVVWMLFYGAPLLKDVLISHRTALQELSKKYEDNLQKQQAECREERKEWFERFSQEREKDRRSRHDSNNQLQRSIAELINSITESHPKSDSKSHRPLQGD